MKAPSNSCLYLSYGPFVSCVSFSIKNFIFHGLSDFIANWFYSPILIHIMKCFCHFPCFPVHFESIHELMNHIIMNWFSLDWFVSLFSYGPGFCLVKSNHISLNHINLHLEAYESIKFCLIHINLHGSTSFCFDL